MIVIVATLHVLQVQASGQGKGRVATATLIFFSDIFLLLYQGKQVHSVGGTTYREMPKSTFDRSNVQLVAKHAPGSFWI